MAHVTIDASDSSILVRCDSCRVWWTFARTLEAAHDVACAHESATHPGESHAYQARWVWVRRLARAARHAADTP